MDAYTDDEFFIQGESEVNMDTVKNNVIEKAAGAKRRIKPLVKILIGVAAAAILAAGGATAMATRGGYTTPMGISVSDGGGFHSAEDREHPIKVEEGNRLMFVADGQHIDITDLVDENTPYIYTYQNSDGDDCYTVVGGAADDYGYIELLPYKIEEDGENIVVWMEMGWNSRLPEPAYHDTDPLRPWFKPWCLAAFDELGLWSEIRNWGENVWFELNEATRYGYPAE